MNTESTQLRSFRQMSALVVTAALGSSVVSDTAAELASSAGDTQQDALLGQLLAALGTVALALLGCVCFTPCTSQLICSCCFKAQRRRAKPDHEAVPKVPQFSADWLTKALRRGCPAADETRVPDVAAAFRVIDLQHGEVSVETEDGGEVINGGGLAGGRTIRVSGIEYAAEVSEGRRSDAGRKALPRSMIAKWCSDIDVVGGSTARPNSVYDRVFLGWILGLRHAMDKAMIHEIHFYNEIARLLVPATGLRLPAVYYTGIDGSADTNCCLFTWRRDSVYCRTEMLLEDLKVSGFEDCGHVVLSFKQALPRPVVEAAMLVLARIHAWGWGGRNFAQAMWTPLMVGCSWAQYLAIIGVFGWNGKLQYFSDLYYDHPTRKFVCEPEIQAMLWCARGTLFAMN